MRRNFTWPSIFCLVPLAIAAWVTTAAWMNFGDPQAVGFQFNLGVDLAGGTILVYEVDPTKQSAENRQYKPSEMADALKKRIDPSNTREITIRPVESTPARVEIVLPMKHGSEQGNLEIQRVRRIVQQQGSLECRMLADDRDEEDKAAIEAIKDLVEGDKYVTEKTLIPPTENRDFAWVELSEIAVREHNGFANVPEGFQ